MLDFRCRSTRGLVMSSLLLLSLLLGVACDPNAEQEGSSGSTVSVPSPEGASEDANDALAPSPGNSPEDAQEELASASPAEISEALVSQPSTTSTQLPPTPAGLRSVADWEKLFLGSWNSTHLNDFLPRSKSLDSYQFYNLGYGIDANTAMYRATGKTQYLDRSLLYINNMVNNAKVSSSLSTSGFRDSYLGWLSSGQEVPLWESYCWRYVTRTLRVIRETPELYSNPTYRAQYDRLLAFTERNIFEKWYKRGANSYIYRSRTHMASHWAYIAMDLSRMTTDSAKKALYLTVVNTINRKLPNYNSSLRQQLHPNPKNSAAYFWSDVWGSSAKPGQDAPHGNGVLAYIVEAHDAGVEWTDDDIHKFVATLNTVLWPAAGKYANYVDGSGAGNGWFTDGLIKLGRYDANLQRRIESHTIGRSVQFYGNGALNARLLSEAAAKQQ
ncbi:MAG: hypothetical protein ACXU86_16045 [Archangium sp.]